MRDKPLALQPTDVAYTATILELIASGRKDSNAVKFHDAMAPLQILCFLGDRIQLQTVRHYFTADGFLTDLLTSFGAVSGENEAGASHLSFVHKVHSSLQNLQSIDDLVHFVDSVRTLFLNDVNSSPNEAIGPTRLCLDSSLGIYCRSFIAKWECLSFDFVCQLYESLNVFLGDSTSKVEEISAVQLQHIPNHDVTAVHLFLKQAEDAAVSGDVHTAERLLHRYFDFNGNDPLLSVASKGTSGSSSLLALAALHHANDPQFTGTRHQQALLQLASMWSQNGHYPLAMAAVEEAMKTAHQRGDHGSVARALLLLYHVVSGLQSSDQTKESVDGQFVTSIGAEEVLRRCLDRCSSLGMNALASQATVLLARLLSSRSLSWLQSSYLSDWLSPNEDEMDGGQGTESGTGSSVKKNWTLLLCTPLGEAKMCSLISKSRGPQGHQPAAVAPAATIKETSVSLSDSEFQSIQAQSDIVAASYWCRLGVPHLAELQCRRSLRASHSHKDAQISDEMVAILGCNLATLIAASAFDDLDEAIFMDPARYNSPLSDTDCGVFENSKDATIICQKRLACTASLNILRITRKILSEDPTKKATRKFSSSKMNNKIEATRTYIATLSSLIGMTRSDFDNSKSLRLAYHLVDLTDTNSTAPVVASSSRDGTELINVSTPENAQAYLLLVRILYFSNRNEARQLLLDLEKSFLSNGLHQHHGEATALSAMCSVTKYTGEDIHDRAVCHKKNQNVTLTLNRILSKARSHHYPVVENIVCKYAFMITAILS
jgi:Anaphase-promoting complex subunit 5